MLARSSNRLLDGLPLQRSTIVGRVAEPDDPKIQAIIPIHCFAHRRQLVFTNTCSQCEYVRQMIEFVQDLTSLLRKSVVVRKLVDKIATTRRRFPNTRKGLDRLTLGSCLFSEKKSRLTNCFRVAGRIGRCD